jgi:large subunit ribosomal protein L31
MKQKIHPRYHAVQVRCTCGNVIQTGSTKKEFSLAVCSNCHPFYTGAEKLLDAAGRVERFQKRFAWTGDKVKAEADKPKTKAAKGIKPLSPVESRAKGNKGKVAVAAAAAAAETEGKKKDEPKKLEAAKAAEPKAEVKEEAKKAAEPKAEAEKAAEPKAEAEKEAEPKAEK